MKATQTASMSTEEEIKRVILSGPPYLENGQPFLSMRDLANELNVSKETIRKNIDLAESHEEVNFTSAGRAKVYWRTFDEEGMADSPEGERSGLDRAERRELSGEELKKVQQNLLASDRGIWLDNAQSLIDSSVKGEDSQERLEAWDALMEYFHRLDSAGYFLLDGALNELNRPDPYQQIDLSDRVEDVNPLPEDFQHLEDFLYGVPLFEGVGGKKIRGLAMLEVHDLWLGRKIQEEEREPEKVAEEHLPGAEDIYYVGNLVDRFAVSLVGFDW